MLDELAREYGFDVVDPGIYYDKSLTKDVDICIKEKSWEGTDWHVSIKLKLGIIYVAEERLGRFDTLQAALEFTRANMISLIPSDWSKSA